MEAYLKNSNYQMKRSDIPKLKEMLKVKQKYKCLICGRDFRDIPDRDCCLDHSHTTWKVRGLLCRLCNSGEAKVRRVFMRLGGRNSGIDYKDFLKGLIKFESKQDEKWIYPPKPKKRKSKTKKKR